MARFLRELREKATIARGLANAYYQVMRYPTVCNSRKHGLPGKLVVSLTSYPPRFGTLHFTLRSLLDQEVRPDEIQLWIAWNEKDSLPDKVKNLEIDGLKVLYCENLKSYKKIIPSLQLNPDAYIVTVDDDCYYPKNLIKILTEEFDIRRPTINTRRPNQITRLPNGQFKPYMEWNGNVAVDTPAVAPRSDLFATGHGGVLYFPGCFDSEVMNVEAFSRICPNADDVWLYWMARRAGSLYRKVGGKFVSANWRGSQAVSLMAENVASSGNDQQILRMVANYGLV